MDTKETQKTNQAAGGEKKNGLCRIVTKKRLGGLAAVIVIALIAGAGWNAWHHQKMAAMRQQEHAALSQMDAIQAEKLGLSLLSEDQAKSAAAEAIGQDVSAISFDEVSLLTAQQALEGPEKKGRARGEKKARRGEPQGGAPGRDGGPERDGAPAPQGQHPQGQPGQPPEARQQGPAPEAQAPKDQRQPDAQAQPGSEPFQGVPQDRQKRPGPAARGGFPHFSYLVRCTVNGMHYTLLVNATDGTVMPLSVHAAR